MVRKVWTVVALASTLALSGCGSNNLFDPTRMLSVFVELSVEPDVVNAIAISTPRADRTPTPSARCRFPTVAALDCQF